MIFIPPSELPAEVRRWFRRAQFAGGRRYIRWQEADRTAQSATPSRETNLGRMCCREEGTRDGHPRTPTRCLLAHRSMVRSGWRDRGIDQSNEIRPHPTVDRRPVRSSIGQRILQGIRSRPGSNREVHPLQAYTIDSENGRSNDPIGADRYRIDINLGTVSFLHHYLMSLEHVFAMKMKQMYEHYVVRRQQRIVQQLSNKVRGRARCPTVAQLTSRLQIKALKSAENNCRTLYEQNRVSKLLLVHSI